MKRQIARLHYLTQDLPSISHAALAYQACCGGVRWVQYRAKGKELHEWIKEARAVKAVCEEFCAVLIVNDSIEVAEAIGADGVHLGKEDRAPNEARRILGPEAIIGATANTAADIRILSDWGVDYIGAGPYRFTATKETNRLAPVLGIDGMTTLLHETRRNQILLPIIAIGGITVEDLASLSRAGAYGVAIASAINKAADVREAAHNILERLPALHTARNVLEV